MRISDWSSDVCSSDLSVVQIFVQADLAKTLQFMSDAERAAHQGGREAGIRAAYDAFYSGDIARLIADFHRENGGLLTMDDLAEYRVSFEPTEIGIAHV